MPLSFNAFPNQPMSQTRSPSYQPAMGKLLSNAQAPMQSLSSTAVTNRYASMAAADGIEFDVRPPGPADLASTPPFFTPRLVSAPFPER